MFRGEVETAVRSGTKSSFSVMGFQHKDAILGLWFFCLTLLMQLVVCLPIIFKVGTKGIIS